MRDGDVITVGNLRRQAATKAAHDLAMIGLDRVDVAAMMQRGDVTVIDVRGSAEWEAGHLPGVPNIRLGCLADRLAEVPTDKPVERSGSGEL